MIVPSPVSQNRGSERRQLTLRIPELDGIRGIAILAVLFYHLFTYSMFRKTWDGFASFVFHAADNGSYGVDLFFVLSGFLITGILLDTREEPHYFRNFYARRALRILPLYYGVLLIIFLCYPHSGTYVLLSFFYLSNIAPIVSINMVNGAMWSLSVEEHFYLFWPFVVRRWPKESVAIFAAAICLAEPVIRGIAFTYGVNVFPYSWFRLDGLATGALIACFVRSAQYSLKNARLLTGALILIGGLAEIAGSHLGIRQHHTRFGAVFEFPVIDMICAAFVLWGVSRSLSTQTKVLRSWPLRICGDLSYCMYLTHCMLMDAYDAGLRALKYQSAISDFGGVAIRAAVVLAASFTVAMLSRGLIERPALRMKKLFQPTPRTLPTPPQDEERELDSIDSVKSTIDPAGTLPGNALSAFEG